jgi:hypothetical protein
MTDDLARLTASDLVAAYRGGIPSPVEATWAALAAIDAGNAAVNAFVWWTTTRRWLRPSAPRQGGAPVTRTGPATACPHLHART